MNQAGTIPDFNVWWHTPLGDYVLAQEQAAYDQAVEDMFGFHAVQVGMAAHDLLRANRMPFRFQVDRQGGRSVCCAPDQLPLATDSIDLMVLPHVLEFAANPHQVMREVSRVLVPGGRVLLTGFNPWSLWGWDRWRRRRAPLVWQGQFYSLPRVKDWLRLLGFDITGGRSLCYVPPCKQEKWLHRLAFMEAAGDRWWPVSGGVYMLEAQKRVPGATLITPVWQDKRRAAGKLVAAVDKITAAGPGQVERTPD